MSQELRAVDWTGSGLALIDQTLLPQRNKTVAVHDVDTLVDAIQRLVVRGAPAIGAAGAYGVAIALIEGERKGWTEAEVRAAVARVREARPTAVNLMVCVDRVMTRFDEGLDAVLEEAAAVQREDVAANRAMGSFGADWLIQKVGVDRPLRLLTHCNTGALATAGWGTALGVIRELHARGLVEVVYADETRPLLQGSRLTAWELVQEGIPHYVQADGAAAWHHPARRGRRGHRRRGPHRRQRRHREQGGHGRRGPRLRGRRHPVPGGGPDHHGRPLDEDRRQHPHRTPRRGGGVGVVGSAYGSRRIEGHNPAFDITPGRLVTGLVTEQGVLEISAGELPGDRLK